MEPRTTPSTRRRIGNALTRARRAVLRRRRLLAAVLAAVAAAAALRALAPPAPASATITVAARDLPAGVLLTDGDLRTTTVPPGAVPDEVARAPVGRTLAAPLTRGEPVTEPRLVGAHLTEADTGTTAVPLRISDPDQVALLTVGDRIDLFATDPQHAVTSRVASEVEVLAVPAGATTTGTAGNLTGRLVVLAIPEADVERITSAAVTDFVTYAWPSG
ncbi:MAG: SAF domain-containing protein [Nocardioidaceae bacterium]|nr:SAF domain-containing protein [Nocardioidaceae bacterium]MCL2613714.1 SAF domain-containing protein [Nocardioidaceae bacterium]